MARAPFKMKSSPAKATLADFFKGIGGKKTDMGKLRATQKRMSRGESEWQHKTRGLAKAGLETRKNAISEKAIKQSHLESEYQTKGIYETPKTPKASKVSKPDWTKAPKVGTQARTDWYKKFNLALDPTTPGYKMKNK